MDLHIKVKPNARQNRISIENGGVVIHVKAPPADGQANKTLIRYLSEVLDIPRSRIAIVSGAGSRFKKISIPPELDAKVKEILSNL